MDEKLRDRRRLGPGSRRVGYDMTRSPRRLARSGTRASCRCPTIPDALPFVNQGDEPSRRGDLVSTTESRYHPRRNVAETGEEVWQT